MLLATSHALLATLLLVPATTFPGAQDELGQEAQEQADQAKRELPVFVRAPIGVRAALLDGQGQPLGTVTDHVIDRKTGQVAFYAVQLTRAGDEPRTVSVPIERFTWDATERQIRLDTAKEALLALPAFDVDQALGRGVPREASAQQQERPKNLVTSEIVGASVMAGESAVGKIEGLLINPQHWKIAFALVSPRPGADAAPILVPWTAMKWMAPPTSEEPTADERAHFALSVELERLDAAPRLLRSDPRTLDAEALERLSAFWGVKIQTDDAADHERGN